MAYLFNFLITAKVVRIINDVGDIKCDICELIIRELDNIVGNNASANKINATIYNLCSQLPGTAAKYVSFLFCEIFLYTCILKPFRCQRVIVLLITYLPEGCLRNCYIL
jgi:hypothetical protein